MDLAIQAGLHCAQILTHHGHTSSAPAIEDPLSKLPMPESSACEGERICTWVTNTLWQRHTALNLIQLGDELSQEFINPKWPMSSKT
jgi:hypothetical protein